MLELRHLMLLKRSEATSQRRLENVKAELKKKIEEILNTQNGIGSAKAFLESLSDNIAICKDEMNTEASDLQQTLAYTYDWGLEISCFKNWYI